MFLPFRVVAKYWLPAKFVGWIFGWQLLESTISNSEIMHLELFNSIVIFEPPQLRFHPLT